MEKEERYNLKTVRLRNLEAAESAIANRDYIEAVSRLKMFANTLKNGSEAQKDFKKLDEAVEIEYRKAINVMNYKIANYDKMLWEKDLLNGLPEDLFREEEMEKINYKNLMDKHQVCWDVSLRYGLIPED